MGLDKLSEPDSIPLYEREVQTYLANNLALLDGGGLRLIQTEFPVDFGGDRGRIDILAEDADGRIVVIEIKRGTVGRDAVGQIQSYMGAMLHKFQGRAVRGILVAKEIDSGTRSALAVASIEVFLFQTHFAFERMTISRPLRAVGLADYKKNYWESLGGAITDAVYECGHCARSTRVVLVGASRLCGLCGQVARNH